MLRRYTSLARTGRLLPVSKNQANQKREQAKAYAGAPTSDCCEVCERYGPVEHSHLFTQKQHPAHRANPLNWLLKCRACHTLWEDNKRTFAARYPKAWTQILNQMQQVNPQAYAFFRHKNPY